MKKFLMVISGFLFAPALLQADACPDKMAVCKEGGTSLVGYIFDQETNKCVECGVGAKCASPAYSMGLAKHKCKYRGGIDKLIDVNDTEEIEKIKKKEEKRIKKEEEFKQFQRRQGIRR